MQTTSEAAPRVPLTLQQIFDKVAEHLLTQGKQSECADQCAYRGVGGAKCAVGCLISNESYSVDLEGKSATHSAVQRALVKSGVLKGVIRTPGTAEWWVSREGLPGPQCLLAELQALHDRTEPLEWDGALRRVGRDYSLETTVIDRTLDRMDANFNGT